MSEKIQNLKGLFTDVKTRTIIIFTGALLLIGIMVGVIGISQKTKPVPGGPSNAAAVPQVASVPGLAPAPSVQYAQALTEANQRAADKAKETGGSAVPTLISNFPKPEKESLADAQARKVALQAKIPPALVVGAPTNNTNTDKNPVTKQMGELFAAWNRLPVQVLVKGASDTATTSSSTSGGNPSSNQSGSSNDSMMPALLRAGDIIFAVLDTAVNTDEPGPVLATVVGGKILNAKLIGTIKRTDQTAQITFTKANLPNAPASTNFNAVAIDPDTGRTALATGVDNHYLMRYGTLFASAFVTGYANAVGRTGQTTTTTPFGGTTTTYGSNTSISYPTGTPSNTNLPGGCPVGPCVVTIPGSTGTGSNGLNKNQEITLALGQVGTQMGSQLAPLFNTPPTVTIASGTSIGVLVMDDVKQ